MALSEETERNGENKPVPKIRKAHFYSTIHELPVQKAAEIPHCHSELDSESLQNKIPARWAE